VFRGKTVRVGINRTVLAPDAGGGLVDSRTGKRYSRRQDRDVLEVTLDRGAREGQRIVFAGKGDVQPGLLPGDVVFVVQVAPHATFQRQGADLVMKREVTLLEALAGVAFPLPTLGGGVVLVKSPPGLVLKPGTVLELPGEGLPVLGHSQVKGSVFVKFEVAFPERCDITPQMKRILEGVLKTAAPALGPEAAGAPEALLRAVDVGQLKQREQLSKDAYDSDEEESGGGGNNVQCAQQ
jgi:DnaJ family protein A protein 2